MKIKLISTVIGLFGLFSSSAIAAPNPTPGGVLWTRPGSSGIPAHIGYWGDPNNGTVKGFSNGVVGLGNSVYGGFGKFDKFRYILRETSGSGLVRWVDPEKPNTFVTIGQAVPDQNWRIGGIGDFDKDGVDDIAWQNISTTSQLVWFMNSNGTIKGSAGLPSVPIDWRMKGAGDFNGDGNFDVVFQNINNGSVVTWHLNSSYGLISSQFVTAPGMLPTDTLIDAGDFDDDGDGDLLTYRPSSGISSIQKFQSSTIASTLNLQGQITTNGQSFTPALMLKAKPNLTNMVSAGGSNENALGDLGTLTSSNPINVKGQVSMQSIELDNRYKFNVTSTQNLSFGVDNSCLRILSTNASGQGLGGGLGIGFSSAGGQITGSFSAGTHYLRVVQASGCNSSDRMEDYTLSIGAVAPSPVQISNINPGTQSSELYASTKIGTTSYFLLDDGLWKSDGTSAGTVLIKAGNPSREIYANGSTLFFGMNGELWKSDGTTAGTVLVKDINSNGDSRPRNFIAFNGATYFSADNGITGEEIWKTDGTSAGTVLVADINTTSGIGSVPNYLTLFNGSLVFRADTTNNGTELIRLQTNNTFTIIDDNINGSSNPEELVLSGSNLFYSKAFGQIGVNGDTDVELSRLNTSWVSQKVDINPGTGSSVPSSLIAWGSDVYVAATGSLGRELYRVNSSGVSTLISDIYPGVTGSDQNSSEPSNFAIVNSKLVFTATDAVNGSEVWSYSGSGTPTRISQIGTGSINAEPSGMFTNGTKAYFTATNGNGNYEPYSTDGTTVSLLKEINTGNSNNDPSIPSNFNDAGNGKTIFSAFTNDFGLEPWITDGTSAGTFNLKDTNTTPRGGLGESVTIGPKTYFIAEDKDKGRELYVSDGSTTNLVSDIVPGVGGSNPANLVTVGTKVYFNATVNGITKLYSLDVNSNSLVIAANINGSTVSDNISNIVATTNGTVYLTAVKADKTLAVFWLDGGSVLSEIKNFGVNGFVAEMTPIGNNVFITARDRSSSSDIGLEPYRVTTAGAVLMGDLNPGDKSSNPYEYVQTANGNVYFAALNETTGYELYKSVGGTGTPTQFIRTAEGGLGYGADGSNLTKLTAVGNEIFFAAYSNKSRKCQYLNINVNNCFSNEPWISPSSSGNEVLRIWRTDGTDAGTWIDPYLGNETVTPTPYISDPNKLNLNYADYPNLMSVTSGLGTSVYSVSNYGQRVDYGRTASNGYCIDGGEYPFGREIRQSFTPGLAKHPNASRIDEAGNPTINAPSNTYGLFQDESAISVSPGSTCMTNPNGFVSRPYTQNRYDARLAGAEDVILGTTNGVIYWAQWKIDRYEVWSMPHSETMTTRYLPSGGVAPRNISFIGSFYNLERGSLELKPAGVKMNMRGFDTVSKTWKQWLF